jgi:dihydrolipoamide dehydrogenase
MEFRERSLVTTIEGDEKATSVIVIRTPDGERIETNFVFAGLGGSPTQVRDVSASRSGRRMRPSSIPPYEDPNVYAVGDLIGAPMEMFKARKGRCRCAQRPILGVLAGLA